MFKLKFIVCFLAVTLAACGNSSGLTDAVTSPSKELVSPTNFFSPQVEGKLPWTQQPLPASATPEVKSYFQAIESAIASNSAVTLPARRVPNLQTIEPSFEPSTSVSVGAIFENADPIFAIVSAEYDELVDMQVRLQPSAMLEDSAFFEINGIPHYGPFVRVYEGSVDGIENSIVHLMVAEDYIRGVARIGNTVHVFRIGMEGNLPLGLQPIEIGTQPAQPPSSRAEPGECPVDWIPGNNRQQYIVEVAGQRTGVNGGRFIPPYLAPANGLGLTPSTELHGRVILDADIDAYRAWGKYVPTMMIGMLIEQVVVYRYELGMYHSISGAHLNLIENYFDPAVIAPWAEFDAWWGDYHVEDRDFIFLLTTTQYNGTGGQASCVGGAGSSYGYFFVTTEFEQIPSWNSVVGHEIGHLYSAHHHYGSAEGQLTDIMSSSTTSNTNQFSSFNRSVIRGWAEEFLMPR